MNIFFNNFYHIFIENIIDFSIFIKDLASIYFIQYG